MPCAVDHAPKPVPSRPAASLTLTCAPFDFDRLILAHGWVQLAPFHWMEPTQSLRRLLTVDGQTVRVTLRYDKTDDRARIRGRVAPAPSRAARPELRRQVVRMLRLDEDFTPFHRRCRRDRAMRHVATRRWGGMLRAPTAFEDVVKTICTANCHWRNTCTLCTGPCGLNDGAFPLPTMLLELGPRRLAARVPVGYRAETIITVARQTLEGTLPLDRWIDDGDVERARAALTAIKGIGEYCVNHILVLLGVYDRLPVDSVVIRHLRDTYHGGRAVPAAKAVKRFNAYGEYAFLAYKFGRRPGW